MSIFLLCQVSDFLPTAQASVHTSGITIRSPFLAVLWRYEGLLLLFSDLLSTLELLLAAFTWFFVSRSGTSGAWLLHHLRLSTTAMDGPIGSACNSLGNSCSLDWDLATPISVVIDNKMLPLMLVGLSLVPKTSSSYCFCCVNWLVVQELYQLCRSWVLTPCKHTQLLINWVEWVCVVRLRVDCDNYPCTVLLELSFLAGRPQILGTSSKKKSWCIGSRWNFVAGGHEWFILFSNSILMVMGCRIWLIYKFSLFWGLFRDLFVFFFLSLT